MKRNAPKGMPWQLGSAAKPRRDTMRRARSGSSRGATPFRKDFGGMREPRSMAPEEEEEKARLYSGVHSNNAFQIEYYFKTPKS